MYDIIQPDELEKVYTTLGPTGFGSTPPLGEIRRDYQGTKKYKFVKNAHSAALAVGNPVCYAAADLTLKTVTRPATAILYASAGAAMGAIPASGYGWVQILGYNTLVDLDGTTDVAIGDSLIGVDGALNLAKSTAVGTAPVYANYFVAAEAWTTNSVAQKKVYINCDNLV